MNFHAHYAGITEPVETCLVGSGSFGRSYLAQSRRTRLINARIAVDMTAEAAGRAFAAAGFAVSARRFGYSDFIPVTESPYYPRLTDALDYPADHKILFRMEKRG